MEENPTPNILRPGQRALAAIVFTDVVNFSERMQAGEERTLQLLERDFATMRDFCRQHDGVVLKTTGDGLLLYFSSAVQAVACALAIQRNFAGNARENPEVPALAHRVGIHLGDVFVSEQDVMGDGVNIAARLQAEAQPGGICISQTVYDVVKNKLELHVTSLGPRELKNIAESIHVYRLLLDAQSLRAAKAAELAGRMTAAVRAASSRVERFTTTWNHPVVRGTAVGLLAAALLLGGAWTWHSRLKLDRQRDEIRAVRLALAAMASQPSADSGRDLDELNQAEIDSREPGGEIRGQFLDNYNFGGLVRYLRAKSAVRPAEPALPALRRSAEQMAAVKGWVMAELQGYTRQQPLRVFELSGTDPKELHVFTELDRRLYFVWGGAVLGRDWANVKPAWVGAVMVGALRNARSTPDREVVDGALAFARIYGVPEIIAALQAGDAPPPAGG